MRGKREMNGKLVVCLAVFLAIVGFVVYSTLFLKNSTSVLSATVDRAVEEMDVDMNRAGEEYRRFLDRYERDKFFLSLIVYKAAIEEIDTLSMRISEAFDDGNPYETMKSDMEHLRALICGLYERYGPFPANLF